jgi:flagellar basal-body rod protein FlgB
MKRLAAILLGYIISVSYVAHADVLSQLSREMGFLAARDQVLSNNIANSHTPNYSPQDIERKMSATGVSLAGTHPSHFTMDMGGYELKQAPVHERHPNGNGVTLEEELMKKNSNAMEMRKIANIYMKTKSIMKHAINGGKE